MNIVSPLVHKKRPTRWHRDGYIASCGVILIERGKLNKRTLLENYSYEWKYVNCIECLKFLKVVPTDFVNKHM